MAGLRGRMERIRRRAEQDAVIIHLQDGSVRTFDKTEVQAARYLAKLDRALGREPRVSEFMEALEMATPESKAVVLALDEEGHHYADITPTDTPPQDLSE